MIDEEEDLKPMSMAEKGQLHQLRNIAGERYPGVVGEILSEYIDSWIEFGYRLGDTARFTRLHKHLVPDDDAKPNDVWTEIG